MAIELKSWFTVKKLTWLLAIIAIASAAASAYTYYRINQIDAFNKAVLAGEKPATDQDSYQAKFAKALYLAKKRYYKEATLLFTNLVETSENKEQKSAAQYNIGNMFFKRGLAINGRDMTVRDEAEYLMRQAKNAYVASLKTDNTHWDAKHNLDRLLGMLPNAPTPGVGESENPGLIMGNIPVGLP